MNFKILSIAAIALGLGAGAAAAQTLRVAATNTDISSITRELGSGFVQVDDLLPSQQEPHSMPLRPSLIQKIRQCNLLITIGLDHEPWLPDAISSSGNTGVAPGSAGFVDCSRGVRLLEIPAGQVDRSRGDLHVFGNTHYWLDPANIRIMSVHIKNALSRVLPARAAEIRAREVRFLANLDSHIAGWRRTLAPLRGRPLVSYHASFPYLASFGGFRMVGTVEVKPGIEPTPAHIARLREIMKTEHVRAIIMEPWYNQSRARSVAQDAGATVVLISPSTPEGGRIIEHFGQIVQSLASRLR